MTRFAGSPKVAAFLSSSPDYGLTGQQGLATNRELQANQDMNEAKLQYQEEKAEADIEAAKYGAQARADVAGANAEAGMIGGIASAVGGLGSALFQKKSPSMGGFIGDYSGINTTTRNYSSLSAPSAFGSMPSLGVSSPPPVNLNGGFGFGSGGSINFS